MTTTTHRHRAETARATTAEPDAAGGDPGATLLELLVVLVILAMLATAVVFAMSGMRADAAGSRCAAERHTLALAVETFFAQHGADEIPASGDDNDRHERTLVGLRLMRSLGTCADRSPSRAPDCFRSGPRNDWSPRQAARLRGVHHDLDAEGVITTAEGGTSC